VCFIVHLCKTDILEKDSFQHHSLRWSLLNYNVYTTLTPLNKFGRIDNRGDGKICYQVDCLCIPSTSMPRAGCRVVRIDLLHFLAGCRTRQLNQALYLSLSIDFVCVVAYYGHLLCIFSLHWYVFCVLVVLVKLSVLAK